MFMPIFAAIAEWLRREANPYLRCPECGAQGSWRWMRWLMQVRCKACGCEWRWVEDDDEWQTEITKHGAVGNAREKGW